MVRAATGEKAKKNLEHEALLLSQLRKKDFPALKTYGEIFEIREGVHAILIDWIPNATLIDAKLSNNFKFILAALVMGVPIDTGSEGWAFKKSETQKAILAKCKTVDLALIKEFAKNLEIQITNLIDLIEKQRVLIGDLQLLISPKGDITIIDPVDILTFKTADKLTPDNLIDLNDSKKETNMKFFQTLMEGMQMLVNIQNSCQQLAQVISQDQLQNKILDLIEAQPSVPLRRHTP